MSYFKPSAEDLQSFEKEGFLIVEKLFDKEEAGLLKDIAKADKAMDDESRALKDATGGSSKLMLRNELRDDLYSTVVRSRRIVDTMESMLGGEVYHYHHKMMLKEPRVGGAWEWHQDYGYWYNNGCLFPYMASCMIAVDRASRVNGCLQVIPGSHLMGRIEHGVVGTQTGADTTRVEALLERVPAIHVELNAGDAVFFHSNLLHCSGPNKSDFSRWTLICCYNAARNDPYKKSHHPSYSPLEKVADERVKEVGREQWSRMQESPAVSR